MDFTEFQEGLTECDIEVSRAVARECFNRIDSDSSGTINFDEFLIALRVCTFLNSFRGHWSFLVALIPLFKPKTHRASAATLALPLLLEYIVTLGNGGGLIPKCHHRPAAAADVAAAAADVQCDYTLRLFELMNSLNN